MFKPQQIAQQFGFAWPPDFERLYNEGMLDWGALGPDWGRDVYPELRKNPPLLLFANDFELMRMEDIQSQLEEFRDPDYWMGIREDFPFVPFAGNGAGDWFCFLAEGAEICVVLLRHDAGYATYKARNLRDFIFRCMLEAVADVEDAQFGLLSETGFREDLTHFLRTHQPWLSENQYRTLSEVYGRDGAEKPLITRGELASILQREIGWERLDEDFAYSE
ncbi:SMI1/KNR4 family protein [Chitinophaga sp. NPDC101104]|uniref:SMI1/KNR4 family protein n=1 Tax=Chitinophaga sp. NPDC101104 TaxID=3390561 RepID=UPI003D017F82